MSSEEEHVLLGLKVHDFGRPADANDPTLVIPEASAAYAAAV